MKKLENLNFSDLPRNEEIALLDTIDILAELENQNKDTATYTYETYVTFDYNGDCITTSIAIYFTANVQVSYGDYYTPNETITDNLDVEVDIIGDLFNYDFDEIKLPLKQIINIQHQIEAEITNLF